MKSILIFVLTVYIFTGNFLYSQQDTTKAREYAENALKYFQKGEFERAIQLLDSAISYDRISIAYPYEKALAFYQKKEFETAIKLFDSLTTHPQVSDQVFQLLGNCYGMIDKHDEAIEAYNKGIAKYPNSGRLYMELGITMLAKTTLRNVVGYWEKGVEVDPNFPHNYFHLADYYSTTSKRVWALLYCEIFQNYDLSPNKNKYICRLMKEVYTAGIYDFNDSTMRIEFTELMVKTDNPEKQNEVRFETAYQNIMAELAPKYLTSKLTNILNPYEIATLRREFIIQWYKLKYNEKFPNILFARHKELLDNDLFDIYNLWLLRHCNFEEFESYAKKNIETYKKFEKWINDNYLTFDSKNIISRYMFDK